MHLGRLYHIAQAEEWQAAKRHGSYWPSNPPSCPFIHFSFGHQLLATANRLFVGRADLMLLTVDEEAVRDAIKVELAPNENESYLHLCRALKPHEVIAEVK
ncbi:MAG: DUF952 domain-containing protein, partial [Proteobacteria bacterium]|nr:DUF952 domain-containing protein [Pseudomonadota bacterium]